MTLEQTIDQAKLESTVDKGATTSAPYIWGATIDRPAASWWEV